MSKLEGALNPEQRLALARTGTVHLPQVAEQLRVLRYCSTAGNERGETDRFEWKASTAEGGVLSVAPDGTITIREIERVTVHPGKAASDKPKCPKCNDTGYQQQWTELDHTMWRCDCSPIDEQAGGAQGERETVGAHHLPGLLLAQRECRRYEDMQFLNFLIGKARASLAQPSPAPELERPEVVGYATAGAIERLLSGRNEEAVISRESGGYAGADNPLMTVAQHDRIVGALRAEVQRWREASDEAMQLNIKSRKELRAAQARIAELEKQEPVARETKTHTDDMWLFGDE